MKISEEEKRRLDRDIVNYAEVHKKQTLAWVNDVANLADWVLRQPNESGPSIYYAQLFFIKTYGLLTEIWDQFESVAQITDEQKRKYEINVESAERVSSLIQKLYDSLTEEELILLDNERQTASHVIQQGYRMRLTRNYELNERYTVRSIKGGKTFTVPELERILDAEMKKYQYSDILIAQYFAEKFKSTAHQVRKVLEELYGPLPGPMR